MNMIDVAIYGSAGYVTGFSVSSTLMLALVNRAFVTGKPVWRLVAWLAVAAMNLALASFAAIFLMTFYTDISSPDYVPRAIAATVGVALGFAFFLGFGYLMHVYIQRVRDGLEDPTKVFFDSMRKKQQQLS